MGGDPQRAGAQAVCLFGVEAEQERPGDPVGGV